MSTAVSVRLPERTVERLDTLTVRGHKRRGEVIADAILVFSILMADEGIGQAHLPTITQMLGKEYHRAS